MILKVSDLRLRTLLLALSLAGTTQAMALDPVVQRAAVPGGSSLTLGISGRVVDSRGHPPRGLIVMVGREEEDDRFAAESVPISEDGTFIVRNLRSGTYVLEARPPAEPQGNLPGFEGGLAVVPLDNANVGGVTITTRPGVTVRGTVRFEPDQVGISGPDVVIHAMLAVSQMRMSPATTARAAKDGTFVLHNLHGHRVLRFGYVLPPDGSRWWPKAVLLDGADITNVPIDFEDTQTSRLEVIFTQRPTGISGAVVDEVGRRLPGAYAFVFSANRVLWHCWSTTTYAVRTDAAGGIRFSIMPPGNYLAVAFPAIAFPSLSAALWNFEELAALATPVVIADGEVTRIELQISRLRPLRGR